MKNMLIILFLIAVVFSQKSIVLTQTNENPFSLKETFKLIDDDEGFYEEVITRVSPNGTFYVYDKGNKTCSKFDKNGTFISSFGKQGNGPGEFSDFILDFTASNDRLIFKNMAGRTVMIFNTDGKYITNVNKHFIFGAQIVINGENLEFHFPKNELTKMLKVTLSKDGKFISKVENKGHVKGALNKMLKTGGVDDLQKTMQQPLSFMPYNGGYAQHYMGEYKIDFINKKHENIKRINYEYNRVKIDDLFELASRTEKKMLKNVPKAALKRVSQVFEKMSNILGGYHSDIIDIIGTHNNYLFVQTKSKDDKILLIDVISANDKIVQKIKIKCDEITSTKVLFGYLLVNQTNEDNGPYTSVYKL